jgi:hypothetical protein
MGHPWFFSADTLQKQIFTKTHGIMSVNPLYLSGNYCLVLFHAMLTVKLTLIYRQQLIQAYPLLIPEQR